MDGGGRIGMAVAMAGNNGWSLCSSLRALAKKSSFLQGRKLDCFHLRPAGYGGRSRRFAPRNDVNMRSRGGCARVVHLSFAPENQRAQGKTGCALHPRSHVQNWVAKRT